MLWLSQHLLWIIFTLESIILYYMKAMGLRFERSDCEIYSEMDLYLEVESQEI